MPGSDRVFLSPSCQGWRPPGRGCLLGGTCLSLAQHALKVGLLLPAERPQKGMAGFSVCGREERGMDLSEPL